MAHAFAFANRDAAIVEVDIFDAETKGFEQTQPAAIEQMNHEAVITFKMGDDGARFCTREHDRQPRRAADAFDSGDEGEFAVEDLLIKE